MPPAQGGRGAAEREAQANASLAAPRGELTRTKRSSRPIASSTDHALSWQPHEPHLAIFGVGKALRCQKECKSFKINNMRICEVDQNIRLGVFRDVYGDLGYGLKGGAYPPESRGPQCCCRVRS